MITYNLNRDYYHLHIEMISWVRDNLGPGGWRVPDYKRWGDRWGIQISFGHQTWYFVKEEDASLFALKWL